MEYHAYRNVCPPHSHTLNNMKFDVDSLSLVSVLIPFNAYNNHGEGQVFQYDTETDGLPPMHSSSVCHWHSNSPESIYKVGVDIDLSRMHLPKIEFGNPTNTTATTTESHPPFTFIPITNDEIPCKFPLHPPLKETFFILLSSISKSISVEHVPFVLYLYILFAPL